MSKMPQPLPGGAAARTLAHRAVPLADRLRGLLTRAGLRSRRVYLVWTRWFGEERGLGDETELRRVEILPTPKVSDLTAALRTPSHHGSFPDGSVRVDQITGSLTEDDLNGLAYPGTKTQNAEGAPEVPSDVSFFWEIIEDDRGGGKSQRRRYRVAAAPWRREGGICWAVVLSPMSDDLRRDGGSKIGDVDVHEV